MFKTLYRRFGIFFSVQNLNGNWYDRDERQHLGPMWRHGRATMFVHPEHRSDGTPKDDPRRRPRWWSGNVTVSWHLPCKHPGFEVSLDGPGGEDDLRLHLGVPLLFDLWVTFERMGFQWLTKRLFKPKDYEGRTTRVNWHHGMLWWQFWHSDSSRSSTTPRWRHGNWSPMDTLFGKENHTREQLRTERVAIPLPERIYPATITFTRYTHKRPRAWWKQVVLGANVEPDHPIPEPGKGENSYDMDDDALYSMYTPAATTEEAIAAVVESVLRTRRRHGGSVAWQPAKAEAAS
jgi:hypothetical protein